MTKIKDLFAELEFDVIETFNFAKKKDFDLKTALQLLFVIEWEKKDYLGSDLVAALTSLEMNDFSHFDEVDNDDNRNKNK